MTKYPRVKQKRAKDCGIACVKCILKYYKYRIRYQIIARRLDPGEMGVYEYRIVDFLNGIDGFESFYMYDTTLDELKLMINKGPVILLIQTYDSINDVNYGHYVVATYYNDKVITFMDPEIGRLRKLEWNNFIDNWYTYKDDDKICHQVISVEQIKNL